MAHVKSVDTYRFNILLPVPLAGKMLTYLRGKTHPARKVDGRKLRKLERRMTPSDLFTMYLMQLLKDVELDCIARKWVDTIMAKNLKQREKDIARGIANRKAPEEKKKPGRVAGKYYPKYEQINKAKREKRAAKEAAKSKNKSLVSRRRGRPRKNT